MIHALVPSEASDAGFLISQLVYGEAMGVGALKKLERMLKLMDPNEVEHELFCLVRQQIVDEANHAKAYREMLQSGHYGGRHRASLQWESTMRLVHRRTDPFQIVCDLHLLIEPFTKIVVQDLVRRRLDQQHFKIIDQILKEEDQHISLGKQLIAFFKRKHPSAELKSILENDMKAFLSLHAPGLTNPHTGSNFCLPNRSKRHFLDCVLASFKVIGEE